jgi:UDP-3-O-[3-hydroxymyristoyl] glucosamine N-acyltransferase
MSGIPAIDNKQWLRCVAIYNRLPELMRELRAQRAAKMAESDSKD